MDTVVVEEIYPMTCMQYSHRVLISAVDLRKRTLPVVFFNNVDSNGSEKDLSDGIKRLHTITDLRFEYYL